MKIITVNLGDRSYPILIQSGILSSIGKQIREKTKTSHVAVISDQTVSSLYGEMVLDSINQADIQVSLFIVPDGEESKSSEQTQKIYTQLIDKQFKRDSLIIALGGGVIGDLAGFIAATFLRGISLIQVPTTLLAQVDSSVGGKVGINHPLGKNLIGSIYQPQLVLIDPDVLKTLDKRELWAGMGEVVKYGLIHDVKFFEFIEKNLNTLIDLKNEKLNSEMLGFCCQTKAQIVEKDEKESGLRRILNFGHTLGHALEAVTHYNTFHHGEAVVHGMLWASWYSLDQKYLSQNEYHRIRILLKRFQIPPIPKQISAQSLSGKWRLDKKQTSKGLNLVLIKNIGEVLFVKEDDILDSVERWLHHVESE